MAATEDANLISLRVLLFFFFGGVGCLLPFLSFHATVIGLNIEEARIISVVSPLIAFIGPAIAGPLVDHFSTKRNFVDDDKTSNNGCIRKTLSSTILLGAVFYSLLLSVPLVNRFDPRQPTVLFECAELGASLTQERCYNEMGCYHYPMEKIGAIRLKNCRFDCSAPFPSYGAIGSNFDDQNSMETEVKTTSTSTAATTTTHAEDPSTVALLPERNPNLDIDTFFGTEAGIDEEDDNEEFGSGDSSLDWVLGRNKRQNDDEEEEEDTTSVHIPSPPHICYGLSATRLCSVYTSYSSSISINVSLKQPVQSDKFCHYPLDTRFSCRIPTDLEKPKNECKVMCDLEDAYVPGSIFVPLRCEDTFGEATFSFWLYLLFRTLGDMFTSISISLIIGATLTAVRRNIGTEFIYATFSYAVFAALTGYIHSREYGPLRDRTIAIPAYFLSVGGFAVLSFISVFILIFATQMPIGHPAWKAVKMRHKSEFFGLLLVLTLLGVLWGPQFNQVPLQGPLDLEIYVGGSLALGALLSIPLLLKADFIIDYCGYSNLLITAFAFYILRYTGLLFLETPWVLLITGSMEVITLSLMLFTCILYIRQLVPKHLTFTAQSLAFAAHFCLGNGIGCGISSLLSPSQLVIESAVIRNTTSPGQNGDIEGPYHLLYCSGAVFSAVVAIIYFFTYHFCFKQKCLAPTFRKSGGGSPHLVHESSGNGTYTPMRLLSNGRQQHQTD